MRGEAGLRVSAKAKDKIEARKLIAPVAQEIKDIAGLDYFGCNEDTLGFSGGGFKTKRETVTVAEFALVGGLGAMLTEIPASSDYFKRYYFLYNQIKVKQLGVSETDLQENGAVSEVCATNGIRS